MSKTGNRAGLEPALAFSDLEAVGEGTRWTILRRMDQGTFPRPDFYIGRFPRWLASSVQRTRDELIAQAARAKTEAA